MGWYGKIIDRITVLHPCFLHETHCSLYSRPPLSPDFAPELQLPLLSPPGPLNFGTLPPPALDGVGLLHLTSYLVYLISSLGFKHDLYADNSKYLSPEGPLL